MKKHSPFIPSQTFISSSWPDPPTARNIHTLSFSPHRNPGETRRKKATFYPQARVGGMRVCECVYLRDRESDFLAMRSKLSSFFSFWRSGRPLFLPASPALIGQNGALFCFSTCIQQSPAHHAVIGARFRVSRRHDWLTVYPRKRAVQS